MASPFALAGNALAATSGFISVHKIDTHQEPSSTATVAAYLTLAAAIACKGGEFALMRYATKAPAQEESSPRSLARSKLATTSAAYTSAMAAWAAALMGVNVAKWITFGSNDIGALSPEMAGIWAAAMCAFQYVGDAQNAKRFAGALADDTQDTEQQPNV